MINKKTSKKQSRKHSKKQSRKHSKKQSRTLIKNMSRIQNNNKSNLTTYDNYNLDNLTNYTQEQRSQEIKKINNELDNYLSYFKKSKEFIIFITKNIFIKQQQTFTNFIASIKLNKICNTSEVDDLDSIKQYKQIIDSELADNIEEINSLILFIKIFLTDNKEIDIKEIEEKFYNFLRQNLFKIQMYKLNVSDITLFKTNKETTKDTITKKLTKKQSYYDSLFTSRKFTQNEKLKIIDDINDTFKYYISFVDNKTIKKNIINLIKNIFILQQKRDINFIIFKELCKIYVNNKKDKKSEKDFEIYRSEFATLYSELLDLLDQVKILYNINNKEIENKFYNFLHIKLLTNQGYNITLADINF